MNPLSLENNEEKNERLTGKAHNHLPPPLAFLPSLRRSSPSVVVGAEEEEKNVGEIGNEGIKSIPKEPLER